MIKNRSLEYKLLIDNYNKNKNKLINNNNQPIITRSTFSNLSFKVSTDIQSTTSKLQKLTQLINRKSLFDDKQLEINVGLLLLFGLDWTYTYIGTNLYN